MDEKTLRNVICDIEELRKRAIVSEEPPAYDGALRDLEEKLEMYLDKDLNGNPANWPPMPKTNRKLAELLQAAGRDITESAADMVGSSEHLRDISLYITIDDETHVPSISVDKEYIGKNVIDTLQRF